MVHIEFTEEQINELRNERYNYPHPRVQRKMDALFLKSQGLTHGQIGKLVGVCQDTLREYLGQYKEGGIEALKVINFYRPESVLVTHKGTIEEEFRNNPPATIKEAASRIEDITGIRRSENRVSVFLKKIGLKRLKTAQVPAKADVLEQEAFMEEKLQPKIEEARQGKCELLFVDASHFVLSAFLGYLWCFVRIFVKSPSGRQRYNVLGAFNAISHELITVTNDSYINANSIIALMEQLLEYYAGSALCLVMDNARYQRCKLVMEFAKEHNIELLFLPSYSPNLNLIERLWKFIKKKCLYNKYYPDFHMFKAGIDNCISDIDKRYRGEIKSLMTLNFQMLKNAS